MKQEKKTGALESTKTNACPHSISKDLGLLQTTTEELSYDDCGTKLNLAHFLPLAHSQTMVPIATATTASIFVGEIDCDALSPPVLLPPDEEFPAEDH